MIDLSSLNCFTMKADKEEAEPVVIDEMEPMVIDEVEPVAIDEVEPVAIDVLFSWAQTMPKDVTIIVLAKFLMENGLLATSTALRGNGSPKTDAEMGIEGGDTGSRRRHLGPSAIELLHSRNVLREYARHLCTYPELLDQFESFVRSTYPFGEFTDTTATTFYKTIIVSIHWAEITTLLSIFLGTNSPRLAQYMMANDYFHFRPREDGSPGYCYYLDVEYGLLQDEEPARFHLTLHPRSGTGHIRFVLLQADKRKRHVPSFKTDDATTAMIGRETKAINNNFTDALDKRYQSKGECRLFVSAHRDRSLISPGENNDWYEIEIPKFMRKYSMHWPRKKEEHRQPEARSSARIYCMLTHELPPRTTVKDSSSDSTDVAPHASIPIDEHMKNISDMFAVKSGNLILPPDAYASLSKKLTVTLCPGRDPRDLVQLMRRFKKTIVFYTQKPLIETDWVPLIPVLTTIRAGPSNWLEWPRLTASIPENTSVALKSRDLAVAHVNDLKTLSKYRKDFSRLYKETKEELAILEREQKENPSEQRRSKIEFRKRQIRKYEETVKKKQEQQAASLAKHSEFAKNRDNVVLILGKCHVCRSRQATLQCSKCRTRVCSDKQCQSFSH